MNVYIIKKNLIINNSKKWHNFITSIAEDNTWGYDIL